MMFTAYMYIYLVVQVALGWGVHQMGMMLEGLEEVVEVQDDPWQPLPDTESIYRGKGNCHAHITHTENTHTENLLHVSQ